MPKLITAQLCMMVRFYKNVSIEVPDSFDTGDSDKLRKLLHNVYDFEDGDSYTEDTEYSGEESEHIVFNVMNYRRPDVVLSEDGQLAYNQND